MRLTVTWARDVVVSSDLVNPRIGTHLLAHVHHLAVCHIFVEHFVERLIAVFIVLDSFTKVFLSLRWLLPIVIRITRGHFHSDVGSHNCRVGTHGFDEQESQTRFTFDAINQSLSAGPSGVGCV